MDGFLRRAAGGLVGLSLLVGFSLTLPACGGGSKSAGGGSTSATESTSTSQGDSTTSSASSGGASSTSDSAASTGDGTVTGDTSTTGASTSGGGSLRPVPAGCTAILPNPCEPVVIADNQGIVGAFNLTSTHLYWRGGNNVMRADVNGGAPEVLGEAIAGLTSVALDEGGIYITTDIEASTPMVASLPLAGGTPTALVMGATRYLDIEVADGTLYYSVPTTEAEGGVYAVSTGGGEPELLYAGTPTILEVWRDYVYFLAYVPEAALLRVPRAGGEVEVLRDPTVAYHLAVNDSGVHLVDELGLIRLPLAGGTPDVLAPINRDPGESSGPALDTTHAYFVDNDLYFGDVVRAGLDASEPSALVSDSPPLRSVAVNDTTLFYSEGTDDGRVLRIDKCGCE